MKRSILCLVSLLLLLAACSQSDLPQPLKEPLNPQLDKEARASFVLGQLVVKFANPSKPLSTIIVKGVKLNLSQEIHKKSGLWKMTFNANLLPQNLKAIQDFAALVSKHASLRFAQPNYIYYAQDLFRPNDPAFETQWNMEAIEMPLAWGTYTRGQRINVAIIDSGKTDHDDLIWSTGADFITDDFRAHDWSGRDADPTDSICPFTLASNGHGTHVAGIVAAQTHNRKHIAGVNESVRLIPVRVLGSCLGDGTTADLLAGMFWAAGDTISGLATNPNPAKILNMSLSANLGLGNTCQEDDPALRDAVNELADRGIVTVVAAGNDGVDARTLSPASCVRAITVGSFNASGQLSSFSNFGSFVDIYAPGGDEDSGILSTYPGFFGPTTTTLMGTSMAAPHVAGVISLMLSFDPSYNNPDAIGFLLRFHSHVHTPMPAESCSNPDTCAGKLNAAALLHELSF